MWLLANFKSLNVMKFKRKKLFHRKNECSIFYLNPEILAKLYNLIYYLILTPTLTLTPQLSPNLNCKPHIKCARMNLA